MMEQQTPSEERAGAEATAETPARRRRGWLSALVAGVALVAVRRRVRRGGGAGAAGAARSSQSRLDRRLDGGSRCPWRVYSRPAGAV